MMQTLLSKKGKRLKCKMYLRLRRPMPPALRTFYIGEVLFEDHYPVASKAYRPERYDGRAVLILAERKGAHDLEAIWRKLIPNGLTSYGVPGNHVEILREPHIGVLAGHLRNCLNNEVHEARLAR